MYVCAARILAVIIVLSSVSAHLQAQSGGVQTGLTANADNATPAPGAGHDYVHLLSETVNPANGSVDIKIGYGAPPSRGITLPAAYVYDTGSVFSLMQNPSSATVDFEQPYVVGQHDSFPVATWSESSYQAPNEIPGTGGSPIALFACNFALGFTFRGPDGVSHNLPLAVITKALNDSSNSATAGAPLSCSPGETTGTVTDGVVSASFVSPSTTLTDVAGWTINYNDNPPPNGPVGTFTVTDAAGTTYFFDGGTGAEVTPGVFEEYASQIEDRNGNIISASGCGSASSTMYCDTSGRPIETHSTATITVGSSTFPGTNVVVGGVTYSVTNGGAGNATVSYTVPAAQVLPASPNTNDIGCAQLSPTWAVPSPHAALTAPVPRELIIVLPTNPATTYELYFGDFNPNDTSVENSYGLINEIVYPDGGWVKYSWGIPAAPGSVAGPNYTQSATFPGVYVSPSAQAGQPVSWGCVYEYSTPVVIERQVSYDGSTVAQKQSFTYTTNWETGNYAGTWASKTTSITTTDNVIGKSALTTYVYQPGNLAALPSLWGSVASEFPVEQTIARYDWGNTTTPLDTETKGWFTNPTYVSQLACDFHTVNTGKSTGHFYQYFPGAPSQVSDDKEYDFGQIASPATACTGNNPTAPTGVTPIREIVTSYATFTSPTSTGGATFVKPSSVVTYGNGTRIAESDYLYDKAALATVSAVNHDTNFGTSLVLNRGNATTITRQCIGCMNATTTYTYDETGQLSSITDPCGQPSCSDMPGATSHTTNYSFTDSPATGNSFGNSNAYLTLVTNPLGQTRKYQYNYPSGQLTQATDENSQLTKYCYTTGGCNGSTEDGLYRLTGISYPDGGSKIVTYSDNAPTPSVTTQTAINSGVNLINEVVNDGMGHVVDSYVNSDPNGQTDVHTYYDGFGRAYKLSNPYRPSTDAPYFTVYTYDALGRKITQTQPDGNSVLQWCYNSIASAGQTNCLANKSSLGSNSWIDFNDEDGHHWQRSYDGLGRLGSVMEPNSSNAPAIETDYSYDALNDLLSVTQIGVSGETQRARTFNYDSLGRLVSATNPETGLVCYGVIVGGVCKGGGYDANGNVSQRTDARNVATNYTYDALNRLLSKTYANDPSGSPSSCYQYDLSSVQYSAGRLTNQWTQSATAGSCSLAARLWTRRAILSYDQMGRVLSEQQYTPATLASGKPYLPVYTYDLAGNLITSTDGVTPNPTTPGTKLTFTNCIDGAGRLQTLTSNWIDSAHPQSLFSAQGPSATSCPSSSSSPTLSVTTYAAFGGLTNAMLGNGVKLARTYDNRLRITAETDTGGATPAATTGSATVPVTGEEQSQ